MILNLFVLFVDLKLRVPGLSRQGRPDSPVGSSFHQEIHRAEGEFELVELEVRQERGEEGSIHDETAGARVDRQMHARLNQLKDDA